MPVVGGGDGDDVDVRSIQERPVVDRSVDAATMGSLELTGSFLQHVPVAVAEGDDADMVKRLEGLHVVPATAAEADDRDTKFIVRPPAAQGGAGARVDDGNRGEGGSQSNGGGRLDEIAPGTRHAQVRFRIRRESLNSVYSSWTQREGTKSTSCPSASIASITDATKSCRRVSPNMA